MSQYIKTTKDGVEETVNSTEGIEINEINLQDTVVSVMRVDATQRPTGGSSINVIAPIVGATEPIHLDPDGGIWLRSGESTAEVDKYPDAYKSNLNYRNIRSQNLDVAASTETSVFSSDGTKLIVSSIGAAGKYEPNARIYSTQIYQLPSAYSLDGEVELISSYSVKEYKSKVYFMSSDGRFLYERPNMYEDSVMVRELSVPYDLDTISTEYIESEFTNQRGIFFHPDGVTAYRMYLINGSAGEWGVETLSVGDDGSLSSLSIHPIETLSQYNYSYVYITEDKRKMYLLSNTNDETSIKEFFLPETGTFDGMYSIREAVIDSIEHARSIAFNEDQSKAIITGYAPAWDYYAFEVDAAETIGIEKKIIAGLPAYLKIR